MKLKIIAVLIFIGSFSSCKAAKETHMVIPTPAILSNDKEIIFPYHRNGKTGLYKWNTENDSLSKVLNPVQGLVFSPASSAEGNIIVYATSETINGKVVNCIYRTDNKFGSSKKIVEGNYNIVDIELSADAKRVYFTTSADFGKSSPLVKAHPRQMDIFSLTIDGQDLKPETNLNAYMISGELSLGDEGKNLYFQMFNPARDSLQKISEEEDKAHANCGAFTLNLENKKLSSLTPINYKELYNKGVNNFLVDFLQPVAGNKKDEIFLLSATTVYKMNLSSKLGHFFYQQSDDERIKKRLRIQAFKPFHVNYLMVKELENKESGFFILNEKGEVLKKFIPKDEQFKKDFE